MLTIQNTGLFTGVRIGGDYWDLDEVITAIQHLVGNEKIYYDYQGSRLRILGVCHKIKQAIHGECNLDFVSNGLNKVIMKEHQIIAPDKNIYYSVEVLWPEIMFTILALNDFIKLHEERFDNTGWNIHIAISRKFQAAVATCLMEHLTEEQYIAFWELMDTKRPSTFRYATQYVDVLNLQLLQLSAEERKESLAAFLFKLILEDEEYMDIKTQLLETANLTKSPLHDLELDITYPDTIDW